MIATFLVFISIEIAGMVAATLFVPAWHRWIYHNARKDWYSVLAVGLDLAIVIVSIVQWFVRPDALRFERQAFGAALMISGVALVLAAWRVNPYFVPSLVAVPKECLIRDGIYRYFTHPGYAGMALATIGKICLFGQMWATVPATIYLVLLLWRADEENRKVLS